jgi:eukaryotic-like serine/threonine-protein kinase
LVDSAPVRRTWVRPDLIDVCKFSSVPHTDAVDGAGVLGGRYRLVERLGEGGMSIIWRARDEVLGRDVAVKLLSARFAGDRPSWQRFHAEARAVARLSHPNIAGVFDYGESGGGNGGGGADGADDERVPFIVMELLTGTALTELIDGDPMPLPWVLRVGAEVASALAAAHE